MPKSYLKKKNTRSSQNPENPRKTRPSKPGLQNPPGTCDRSQDITPQHDFLHRPAAQRALLQIGDLPGRQNGLVDGKTDQNWWVWYRFGKSEDLKPAVFRRFSFFLPTDIWVASGVKNYRFV